MDGCDPLISTCTACRTCCVDLVLPTRQQYFKRAGDDRQVAMSNRYPQLLLSANASSAASDGIGVPGGLAGGQPAARRGRSTGKRRAGGRDPAFPAFPAFPAHPADQADHIRRTRADDLRDFGPGQLHDPDSDLARLRQSFRHGHHAGPGALLLRDRGSHQGPGHRGGRRQGYQRT